MTLSGFRQPEILNGLYLDAAGDLLAAYEIKNDGVRESRAAANWKGASYVSALGATGAGIALSSLLTIPKDLLVRLHPLGTANVSSAELEDWCRELNNQIVGRMKNKLLRYGVVVSLGLPVLLSGTDVVAVAVPDATLSKHAIQTEHGTLSLALQMLIDPALQLEEVESSGEEALLEGSVAFF